MVDIPDKDLLAPGHRGCAGCGASIAVKLALNALGENTVAISATGCLEVMTTPYPESSWEVPFIHVAFENSGAVASGVQKMSKHETPCLPSAAGIQKAGRLFLLRGICNTALRCLCIFI